MKRIMPLICLFLALMIAIVSMPVSYSWFEPDNKEGIGLEFKDETKLRAQTCSVQTYRGTIGNKLVHYEVLPVSNSNITISASETAYFKTVVSNSSHDYDTVVSLFISSFAPSGGTASICVSYPTNSVRTYKDTQKDLHIVRNAYVPKLVETDANPGLLVVEWFVKCESGSVTFNPSQVFLMYN